MLHNVSYNRETQAYLVILERKYTEARTAALKYIESKQFKQALESLDNADLVTKQLPKDIKTRVKQLECVRLYCIAQSGLNDWKALLRNAILLRDLLKKTPPNPTIQTYYTILSYEYELKVYNESKQWKDMQRVANEYVALCKSFKKLERDYIESSYQAQQVAYEQLNELDEYKSSGKEKEYQNFQREFGIQEQKEEKQQPSAEPVKQLATTARLEEMIKNKKGDIVAVIKELLSIIRDDYEKLFRQDVKLCRPRFADDKTAAMGVLVKHPEIADVYLFYAYNFLAQTLWKEHNYVESIKTLDTALDWFSRYMDCHPIELQDLEFDTYVINYMHGMYDRTSSEPNHLGEKDKAEILAYQNAHLNFMNKKKKLLDAISYVQAAVNQNKEKKFDGDRIKSLKKAAYFTRKALDEFEQANYKKVIEWCEKAFIFEPTFQDAVWTCALAHFNAKQYQEAKQHYIKLTRLEPFSSQYIPENVALLNNLIESELQLHPEINYKEEAKTNKKKSKIPTSDLRDLIAPSKQIRKAMNKGRYQDASVLLMKYICIFYPNTDLSSSIFLDLALVYKKLGDAKSSGEFLEIAKWLSRADFHPESKGKMYDTHHAWQTRHEWHQSMICLYEGDIDSSKKHLNNIKNYLDTIKKNAITVYKTRAVQEVISLAYENPYIVAAGFDPDTFALYSAKDIDVLIKTLKRCHDSECEFYKNHGAASAEVKEQPKAEAPKAEAPKAEAPKAPKTVKKEAPKQEKKKAPKPAPAKTSSNEAAQNQNDKKEQPKIETPAERMSRIANAYTIMQKEKLEQKAANETERRRRHRQARHERHVEKRNINTDESTHSAASDTQKKQIGQEKPKPQSQALTPAIAAAPAPQKVLKNPDAKTSTSLVMKSIQWSQVATSKSKLNGFPALPAVEQAPSPKLNAAPSDSAPLATGESKQLDFPVLPAVEQTPSPKLNVVPSELASQSPAEKPLSPMPVAPVQPIQHPAMLPVPPMIPMPAPMMPPIGLVPPPPLPISKIRIHEDVLEKIQLPMEILNANCSPTILYGGKVREAALRYCKALPHDYFVRQFQDDSDLATGRSPAENESYLLKSLQVRGIDASTICIPEVGLLTINYPREVRTRTVYHSEFLRFIHPIYGITDPAIKQFAKRLDSMLNTGVANIFGETFFPFPRIWDDIRDGVVRVAPQDPEYSGDTRTWAEISYSHDPIRMLRLINLATRIKFRLGDEEQHATQKLKEKLLELPHWVINKQLKKLFSNRYMAQNFHVLWNLEVFQTLFPILSIHVQNDVDGFLKLLNYMDSENLKIDSFYLLSTLFMLKPNSTMLNSSESMIEIMRLSLSENAYAQDLFPVSKQAIQETLLEKSIAAWKAYSSIKSELQSVLKFR